MKPPREKAKDRLVAAADALRVFPTVVWRAELAPVARRRIATAVRPKLDELRDADTGAAPDRWQSIHSLHELAEFQELNASIREASAGALDNWRIKERDVEITGCWANVNAPGSSHGIHSHPNNYLSGVYYVSVPDGGDTINFHDPRVQTGILRLPVTALTADNADQVVVQVKEGTLLLFPAWLQHSVDANRGTEARISVSFNLTFADYAARFSGPLWSSGAEKPDTPP